MNNLKNIRLEKGVKLSWLSYKTGISIGYLCHLEKGTRSNPSYNVMKNIAVALDKSITDIFK